MMDSKRRNSTNCNGQVSRGLFDLPPDMISDILCRLPIESILTCRVVCKTWCAMTRDPCFINKLANSKHTRIILKPLRGINISDTTSDMLLLDIEDRKATQIPIGKMLVGLQIMCSCNGFLCMASAKKLNPVVIFNPITGQRVVLPSSRLKSAVSRHEVGLGFDPSTSKYKVVRAYTVSRREVRKFEIVALGERSWRKLNEPPSIISHDGLGVVSWHGDLYWTMNKGVFITIVQFDVSGERFRVISFPEDFSSDHTSLGLIDVDGHLTLVQNEGGIIELWRLTGNKHRDDLAFCLQETYDTRVKWGGGLCAEFLCQFNQESFLLQVGFLTCQTQRQENLTQYFPGEIRYSNLEIPGVPRSFKAVCFKPSLISLPAA